MRQHVFHWMLLIALILQGVVAVGAGVPVDHGQEQHCAGHEVMQEHCACCPDGGMTGMSCTVQCTVSQAFLAVAIPVRLAGYSTNISFAQPDFAGPSYAPLVPPPIA